MDDPKPQSSIDALYGYEAGLKDGREESKVRIEKLQGLLDTWQVQWENGRALRFVNEETAKILKEGDK